MTKLMIRISAVLVLAGLGWYIINPSHSKPSLNDKAAASVKIVRSDERSGGTGVILESGELSTVLTNNHVCEVVAAGGLVITDDGRKFLVYAYQQSNRHDLCLITVAANLGITTGVANNPPAVYSEATIAGHPSLLPTIITKGHFSGKTLGQIITGIVPCTEEDFHGPNSILCMFLGGIPTIRTYEMQVVSATIKPGSSGSAVYNSDGQIAGLVFAGQGELGYAMIVPHEYVANFLNNELPNIKPKFPTAEARVNLNTEAGKRNCERSDDPLVVAACKLLKNSTLYME